MGWVCDKSFCELYKKIGYTCSKGNRQCESSAIGVEPRTLELYKQVTGHKLCYESLKVLKNGLAKGYRDATALSFLHREKLPFSDNQGFLDFIVILNRTLFGHCSIECLGRFRQIGEKDVFVGSGKFGFKGLPAHEIPTQLKRLYEELIQKKDFKIMASGEFVSICALVLEEFLYIHPFHDGNGRVGRLLLDVLASTTPWFFFKWPSDPQGRKEYYKAVSRSHLHRLDPEKSKNLSLLREWLSKALHKKIFVDEK